MARHPKFLLPLMGILLFALTLLASGLHRLEFAPTRPFDFSRGDAVALTAVQIVPLITLALVIGLFLLFFLFPRQPWRHWRPLTAVALALSLCVISLMWLSVALPPLELPPEEQALLEAQEEPTAVADAPPLDLPALEAIPLPQRPVWVAAVATALLTIGLIAGVAWAAHMLGLFETPPATPLAQLAEEAQRALDQLHAGDDIQEVIRRCYWQMEQALAEAQGLERPQAMTPREFETRLQAYGLPAHPITQLTRLFEATRYGGQAATADQQQTAVAALQAIVAYAPKG